MSDIDKPAAHWWPCAEFTDGIANAVLEANWEKAKQLSREWGLLSAKCDLTYYQTVVSFERDTTVLDRIVEATAEE